MIKPTFVNGSWRKPVISGRNKAILRGYFERAGVPWIYEKPAEEIDMNSPYNKRPKGTRQYNTFEQRLSLIRKNLSTADERLEAHRINKLTNKKQPITNQIDIIVYKHLLSEATAAKFAAKGQTKKKDTGSEERKSPSVKS